MPLVFWMGGDTYPGEVAFELLDVAVLAEVPGEAGLAAGGLVARLDELGFTGWRQSKIAKLEKGEVKRIPLDSVLGYGRPPRGPRCELEELERDAHGPDEDNGEDHAYEDADDDCDYPLPVQPHSETEWTGRTPPYRRWDAESPRAQRGLHRARPRPLPFIPPRCASKHACSARRGLAVMALAAEWVRRALRPVLIRLSNPSFADDLCAHLRNSGFTTKRRGSRTIEVGRADAPTPEQEAREIDLHLRVWRATNPGVIALIDR